MANTTRENEVSNPFTQFYGQLLHQGNMLADHIRTSTYQQAFLRNAELDFQDKIVLVRIGGTGGTEGEI